MHEEVKKIFIAGGATEQEFEAIEKSCVVVAEHVREVILDVGKSAGPELELPVRMLLCRVIHADMQRALAQFSTHG